MGIAFPASNPPFQQARALFFHKLLLFCRFLSLWFFSTSIDSIFFGGALRGPSPLVPRAEHFFLHDLVVETGASLPATACPSHQRLPFKGNHQIWRFHKHPQGGSFWIFLMFLPFLCWIDLFLFNPPSFGCWRFPFRPPRMSVWDPVSPIPPQTLASPPRLLFKGDFFPSVLEFLLALQCLWRALRDPLPRRLFRSLLFNYSGQPSFPEVRTFGRLPVDPEGGP